MALDRSSWRNVHLWNSSTGEKFGGFYQKGSITEANLIWILRNILLVSEKEWTIKHRESGRVITSSNNLVKLGNYDLIPEGEIKISDEAWFARINSHAISGRENAFCNGVRARDQNCVLSGVVNEGAPFGVYISFEAVHIFPLEQESLWVQYNYGQSMTNEDNAPGISKINLLNSVQNGLLISASLHAPFDQYILSINPDDGYKITTFMPNSWGVDGRILDPICRDPNNPNHVSDELLRWHFRQSILANMRGAGEPVFESDFPPGTDKMAILRVEPYGKERLEMEISSRLKSVAGEHD